MDAEKYIDFVFENGLNFGPIISQYLIEIYESLNVSSELKDKISSSIDNNQDFEVSLPELEALIPELEIKIEELLNSPDFDPVKKDLRKKFPGQYGNQLVKYKEKDYYLYTKTLPIDSLINRAFNFNYLVEKHIKSTKPLKFNYRE